MMNRSIAALLIAVATALSAAGCATSGAADGVSASIPSGPSPLNGTWYGTGYEVLTGATGSPYIASYILRIDEDGTATLTGRLRSGETFQYSGAVTVRGDRGVLSETNGSHWVSLKWSGSTLYAVMDMNSWRRVHGPVAIQFARSEQEQAFAMGHAMPVSRENWGAGGS
jgi:hypothetical protein